MAKEKEDNPLKIYSDITVQELKAIAASGSKLTAETLYERLSVREEIRSLLNVESQTESANESERSGDETESKRLRSQIETYQVQKEKLLRQLDEAEESETRITDFFRRVILFYGELLRSEENGSLHEPLEAFKTAIKSEFDIHRLEEIFQQIRDIAFKEDVDSEKPSPSIFSRWFKRDSDDKVSEASGLPALQSLREAYGDIINELKLNLDETAFKRLSQIESRINTIGGIDEFLTVRQSIVSLIQDYIAQVSGEREEAAAFIREIGKRLIEVESHILDSLPYAKDMLRDNNEFNDMLEMQFQGLRENVDFSKSLAELKEAVISSLTFIQDAIREKRGKDSSRMTAVEERMGTLKETISQMKEEVSSARQRAHELEKEILVDPLTGVYNRRAYDKRIKEELLRFMRHGSPFSIVILDVDHFKSVNDRYGHAVGDLCLKEIIVRVQPVLRESDFLARFGGEEFVVLLPETERKGAVEAAEKLRQSIEKTEFLHRGDKVAITISLGVTQVTADDQTPESLFTRVDRALYRAKNEGRNRVAYG
jgi:diguanylate cyclase (GGDEF)-like protein